MWIAGLKHVVEAVYVHTVNASLAHSTQKVFTECFRPEVSAGLLKLAMVYSPVPRVTPERKACEEAADGIVDLCQLDDTAWVTPSAFSSRCISPSR